MGKLLGQLNENDLSDVDTDFLKRAGIYNRKVGSYLQKLVPLKRSRNSIIRSKAINLQSIFLEKRQELINQIRKNTTDTPQKIIAEPEVRSSNTITDERQIIGTERIVPKMF